MNHHKSKSQSQSIVISEGGGAYNGFQSKRVSLNNQQKTPQRTINAF